MVSSSNMLKVFFTPKAFSNPYQDILANSLKQYKIHIEYCSKLTWSLLAYCSKNKNTIIHFHWISDFYRGKRPWLRIIKFTAQLIFLRLLKSKIVWTAHNIFPHRRTSFSIDFFGRILISLLANTIIVHCQFAKIELAKRFYRKKRVFVIPHGNYIDFYKNYITRSRARAFLDIDNNKFVFLCFGKILLYKGIERAINAVKRMRNGNVLLLIAGQCSDADLRKIKKLCVETNRIQVVPGFIPDNIVQYYFNAADALVTPFSEVLSSGTVILGLSFGIPIIAPKKGCLQELVDRNTGILYEDDDHESLLNAMNSIQKKNRSIMKREAYLRAKKFDWAEIAHSTFLVYMSTIK